MGKNKRQLSLDWLEFRTRQRRRYGGDPYRPRLPGRPAFREWLLDLIITTFLILPGLLVLLWLYWAERSGVVLYASVWVGFIMVLNLLKLWNQSRHFSNMHKPVRPVNEKGDEEFR
ncbi:MAG TPA: hypothetical protein PKM21_05655 [Anaerolineales bacterium]|nr:hypothetical protein [Anaerolineales bacterium]